jgi:hypothetical protein
MCTLIIPKYFIGERISCIGGSGEECGHYEAKINFSMFKSKGQ